MIVVRSLDLPEFILTKQELEKKLASHRSELRKLGVVSLAVFGSVARNESTRKSDIELLVEFDCDIGLFQLFEIQHWLEEIIGVPKVDLIQKAQYIRHYGNEFYQRQSMSHRLWKYRIKDILESVKKIQMNVEQMEFEDFQRDEKTIDAVIRNFIVIGEAARHIPDDISAKYPNIPWRVMGDMRNFAVHEYWALKCGQYGKPFETTSHPCFPT